MPRSARLKSFDSIYHIMVRSISDVVLYKENDDKDKYLELVKKYQKIFNFKVYAYCLMDTHAHFIFDANGADISKIMHGINQSYAQYYNRKYERHGHLFQDRFKSMIVNDDRYLITLSCYIHNNPSDIKMYKGYVQKYKYSSLGVYLNIRKDYLGILDKNFILSHFENNTVESMNEYHKLVRNSDSSKLEKQIEFKDEVCEYRSERKVLLRGYVKEDVINFIFSKTLISKANLSIKYCRKLTETRAVFVFLMRSLCNFKYKEICNLIGNLTQSRVSMLCSKGLEVISSKPEYANIVEEFIKRYETA